MMYCEGMQGKESVHYDRPFAVDMNIVLLRLFAPSDVKNGNISL